MGKKTDLDKIYSGKEIYVDIHGELVPIVGIHEDEDMVLLLVDSEEVELKVVEHTEGEKVT